VHSDTRAVADQRPPIDDDVEMHWKKCTQEPGRMSV